jgi:hypothetical protein
MVVIFFNDLHLSSSDSSVRGEIMRKLFFAVTVVFCGNLMGYEFSPPVLQQRTVKGLLHEISLTKNEIELRYGVVVETSKCIEFCKQEMLSHPSFTEQDRLQIGRIFEAISMQNGETAVSSTNYYQFIQMNIWPFASNEQELVLPDKMASGFMFCLGGAVLCVVPGLQPYGLAAISTGCALIVDGIVEGERPYYTDRPPQ